MPGFPSYCTDSLLEIPPSNTVLVWLSIGLRAILDAYPPIPPKQVTVSCVPLTSYGFLQTLPLASNALAIWIIFPLVRVTPLSFKWTGLPASLGKQKSKNSFFTIKWKIWSNLIIFKLNQTNKYHLHIKPIFFPQLLSSQLIIHRYDQNQPNSFW